ncbi:LOW QUALITY PROTEIN: integral membrane protein, partial [Streptomyces viridochromogenes DSM 40736]
MVTATRPLPRAVSVRHLGPNWYATVMGTAVVAGAGAALPAHVPGLRGVLAGVWAVSLVLLLVLLGARTAHWLHHRDQARAHLLDPATAPFYGCLAMALPAVGGGALTVGRDWIGTGAAVTLGGVLFGAGTALGLAAAVAVPYLMAVRHRVEPGQATPVWLLPLVAPMVSAAVGPLLVPRLPPGQPRATLLLLCFAAVRAQPARDPGHAAAGRRPAAHLRAAAARPHPDAVPGTGAARPVHHRRRRVRGRRPRGRTGTVRRGLRCPRRAVRRARDGVRAAVVLPRHRPCAARPAARDAVLDDLVVVHLPGRHLCHGRRGAGPAHRARGLLGAGGRAVRRAGRRMGHGGARHRTRAAQGRAARSARSSTRGASASDGPYHVRCRPL